MRAKDRKVDLGRLFSQFPDLEFQLAAATKPYTLPLIRPNIKKPLNLGLGGGILGVIGGRAGILTAHHVALMYMNGNDNNIYTADPVTGRALAYKHKQIISLPHHLENNGLDLAFIELESESTITTVWQAWDLDKAAGDVTADTDRYGSSDQLANWLWCIHASPGEERELIASNQFVNGVVFFPKAACFLVAPSRPIEFTSCHQQLTKKVDKFYIDIVREGRDAKDLPSSFVGASGSALWQVSVEMIKARPFIKEIQLAGIVVQQIPHPKIGPATDMICRGHISLFSTFYPYCSAMLAGKDVNEALTSAGFHS